MQCCEGALERVFFIFNWQADTQRCAGALEPVFLSLYKEICSAARVCLSEWSLNAAVPEFRNGTHDSSSGQPSFQFEETEFLNRGPNSALCLLNNFAGLPHGESHPSQRVQECPLTDVPETKFGRDGYAGPCARTKDAWAGILTGFRNLPRLRHFDSETCPD